MNHGVTKEDIARIRENSEKMYKCADNIYGDTYRLSELTYKIQDEIGNPEAEKIAKILCKIKEIMGNMEKPVTGIIKELKEYADVMEKMMELMHQI
ncbi:MAG: hypothetical protein IJN37_00475 [Clostridia bacterium]|nr:hypothetical protein [Clostridia bacterium]